MHGYVNKHPQLGEKDLEKCVLLIIYHSCISFMYRFDT